MVGIRLRTSGRGPSLLASRGGLTGAFNLAPVDTGTGPFVSSSLVNEDTDCIFVKVASLRVNSGLEFWRLMVRCVSGDGGRGFIAWAISRGTKGTSAEDTMASAYACVSSSYNVKLQNETHSYDRV
jgi:hypothetical protein